VDKRIIPLGPIPHKSLKNAGLGWLGTGGNEEYIAPAIVQLSERELQPFKEAAAQLYDLMIRAAQTVASQGRWAEVGIPPHAVNLVKYSLQHEMGQHLVCRFDFAGGLDGIPLKMLELNADTCSLMPETAIVQDLHRELEARKLPKGQAFNQLMDGLAKRLRHILQQHPDKAPALLLSGLGHDEDWLNTEIITKAAKKAGMADTQEIVMDRVIFSPEEGIFFELHEEEFRRYDFWFKFVPWDLIVFEETELFEILEHIIRNKLGVVLNPAFTMLLQSKGLMKIMYELEPYNPYLLKTSLTDRDFPDRRYVRKPYFGRMGENIAFFNGSSMPDYETEGDYGHYSPIYQEIAQFNMDRKGHRYQPSIFWTGEASALCFRRQDDLILDDDAEFVGHIVAG
jgi:glutathionylspermidine synthase